MRSHFRVVLASVLVLASSAVADLNADIAPLVARTWNGTQYACKTYYDDPVWLNPNTIRSLNSSVDGTLQLVVPPGASCHNTFQGPLGNISTYNAAKCAQETANFANEQWTTDHPAAALWTYFTNDTCRPTTDPTEPCTLGNYGVYVVMAKTKEHIFQGVQFARQNGMRLIIRNTGHDFMGRSVGWGALVINTHSFKKVTFTNKWTGPGDYRGGAVTVGSGVQGRELLRLANKQNPPLSVVVGECPTVGVAGGLPGGGGHGPLTTLKGWAVDNALEFTVITAGGDYLTANTNSHADLFWALRDGGPGNYAAILTVTYKTHLDMPSSGVILNINSTHTNNTELFWKGVSAFHKHSNHYSDNGLYVYYVLGMGPNNLNIQPFVGFNKTAAELTAVLQPLYDDLKDLGVPYSAVTRSYPTLFALYISQFDDEAAGVSSLTGGWMFSQTDVATNNTGIITAFRNVISNGGFLIGHMWNAGHGIAPERWNDTATHPAFRNASDFLITGVPTAGNAPLGDKEEAQRLLTDVIDAGLRAAGPGGASYVNENDPFQPDWQGHFWGREGFERLVGVKRRYDPLGVFYAVSTPGSEGWVQIEGGTRLCRKI